MEKAGRVVLLLFAFVAVILLSWSAPSSRDPETRQSPKSPPPPLSDHVNRPFVLEETPDAPAQNAHELADFRLQFRQRLLCTAEEAENYAKFLTGTTDWVRHSTVRTTIAALDAWQFSEPIADVRTDESLVVWAIAFETADLLTMRAKMVNQLFAPTSEEDTERKLESHGLIVYFDELGRLPGTKSLEGLFVLPSGEVERNGLDHFDKLPEISSHQLAWLHIRALGICDEPIPTPRPTPGATLVYPSN
jgi:hypothetical protein